MATGYFHNTSVFSVSSSSLSTIAKCDLRAVLAYAYKVFPEDKTAPLLIGSLGHEVLRFHYLGYSPEKCMNYFDLGWEQYKIEEAVQRSIGHEHDRLQQENVRIILEQYLLQHPLDKLPYKVDPARIEWRRYVPLGKKGDILLELVLDAIVEWRTTGALYIIDHKFTGKLSDYWQDKWRLEAQITAYLYGAQRLPELQGKPIAGAYLNGIELSLLPGFKSSGSRKCPKHKVPYEECRKYHANFVMVGTHREPWAYQNWLDTAYNLASRLKWLVDTYSDRERGLGNVDCQGTFNGSCMFCDYREFCAAGKPVDWIGRVLIEKAEVIEKEGL